MQNIKNGIEHISPTHFLTTTTTNDTRSIQSTNNSVSTAAIRPQNFSFASTYATSRFSLATNNKFGNSLPLGNYPIKPITSFTVLNNEELPYNHKPNAIVRPLQRTEDYFNLSRAQHDLSTIAGENSAQQQSEPSSNSVTQPVQIGSDVDKFTEELNRKLRFLRQRENQDILYKSKYDSRNGSTGQELLNKRPLFITTVPTGVFLPPPKELPLPAFLRQHVYAYSSHPVVLNNFYTTNNNINNNNINNNNNDNNNSSSHFNNNSSSNRNFDGYSKDKVRSSTAPITAADKDLTTNAHTSRARTNAKSTIAGEYNLTKQQFLQQIENRRSKREVPPPCEPFKNVMVDKRVCRGSNFAQALMEDIDPFDKPANLRRRKLITSVINRKPRGVIGTPPPVKGRKHEVIQTEKYLEELFTRPVEMSIQTQTDLFLEKPLEPPYRPTKVGIDAATEIGDGELFHFDAEAQPIIEILVDSCIEQSMLEVAHEQELEAMRKKQEEYLAKREAELAELRRLEAQEMRLQAEKERRLRQEKLAKEMENEVQKGVTAAKLLQGHIAGILPEVLENLEPATDAIKKEQLMNSICPWLTKEVAEEVGQIVDSREILTAIIQEIIKHRACVYADYCEEGPESVCKSGEECEDYVTCDVTPGPDLSESCKESSGFEESEGCPPGV
ncbi:uncharacterized protein LOC119677625 [Teleopsis dalmanni]|uniref:uncharacterized protein LOC119677625 n=1 Tax=Teleopsis dalmanni TaxID=139649 RepID=UPI0018CCA6C4|nr:uncharacterized protein LOC119677625 [Teleopsis dalmanni]